MRPIIENPHVNPLHFVAIPSSTDPRMHGRQYWQDLFYNRLRDWEQKEPWFQPVQINDRIRLQFNISDIDNTTIELYNKDGIKVFEWSPALVVNVAGNIEPYTGQNTPLNTYYYRFSLSDYTEITEGYYALSLRVAGDELVWLQGEPMHVKVNHRDTVLIEYKNNTNDYNAIFEQTNCLFRMRLPGDVHAISPDFEYTSYKNQKNRVAKLSAQPGTTLKLSVGGIPDYMHVRLNAALQCDNITIEGTRFVLDEGAKWEETIIEGLAIRGASITIREEDPDRSTFTLEAGALDIASVPGSYPYAVQVLAMGETTANLSLINYTPRIIHNSSELDALVTALNALRETFELNGVFTRVTTTFGFKITYTNAPDERYVVRDAKILTSSFNVSLTIPTGGGTADFAFTQGFIVADWGDGTAENGYAFAASQTMRHLYTAGNKTLTIYGNLGDFGTSGSTAAGYMTALGGVFPPTTTGITLVKTKITAFDGNMLNNCLATLQTLALRQGILATIDNVYNKQFFRLTSVSFASNKLTAGYVGVVLKMVYEYANPINLRSGNLILNGQTPAAPPAFSAVQAFKNPLINSYGWNVTTD